MLIADSTRALLVAEDGLVYVDEIRLRGRTLPVRLWTGPALDAGLTAPVTPGAARASSSSVELSRPSSRSVSFASPSASARRPVASAVLEVRDRAP